MLTDVQRSAGYLVALLLVAALLWLLGPVLSPFVAAAIFAYICVPLVARLARHRVPRTVAVGLVMLLVLLIIIALLLVLVPLVDRQVAAIAKQIPAFTQWLNTQALPWVNQHFGLELDLDPDRLKDTLAPVLQSSSDVLRRTVPTIASGGIALVGFFASLALFPVVLFYFLRDWNGILHATDELLPRRPREELVTIAREVDLVLGEFLRGQLAVMLALSVYYTIGLWLVGLNSALSIGLLTGVLAFVPYLGFTLGVVLATLVGLIQFHSVPSLLPIWLVFVVGQLLESYVLTPLLVGDRVGLHPVWVIFAILAFGHLLGFVGVLLAVPLAAIVLVLLRHFKRRYQASELYKS